ncbi:hypothetical protein BKA62DRAFT_740854 [Auriculariales sp. MPI-PUGE-AT-0066]|nr:hypothetical protein BKA62DRAFT_740854 [Auriculariales sp. MPI-PUGE-AT-0066]
MALLWMTEPAHYRECPDDGLLSATLFPLLVSAACLYSTRERWYNSPKTALPDNWLIEPPATLPQRPDGTEPPSPLLSLIYARQSLVQLSTLCSGILLAHVTASTWREYRCVSQDRLHHRLPHGEARRVWSYIQFGTAVSVITLALKAAFIHMDIPLWQELSFLEIGVISVFHQFALYVMIQLGMVSQIATGMFMMTFNMTSAQIWPLTTGFIKTFTLPTPLAIFQIALIPGSFLTGFLLSPLLALSRHIAQRPIRRLRFPEERKLHRRLLAAGFYLGAALVVGGMVGMWARWCLGGRDPWIWAVFWIVQGRRPWSRPALLTYWGVLGTISVAGWNRQLARIRKYRHLSQRGDQSDGTGTAAGTAPSSMVDRASGAATELLDAADKHVPTLGLNARRKFFHALAVVMFVPGIAVDPAFTHLSFSAAFSLFTFAEYVRYFALYPFGAAVHVFLSEFLDHKDSGTAILSHFYLLAGCALSLWLEGSSRILEYTGVLSLGVGDAMASIVGKRVGRRRWSEASGKTIEGSAALVGSVLACALVLRALGLAETFSIWRYGVVCCMGALLEALSVQNDNLTLPLLMWSLGTLWL